MPNRYLRHPVLSFLLSILCFLKRDSDVWESTLRWRGYNFHSGIEPGGCEVYFYKIPFWNWTTFSDTFSSQNHLFLTFGPQSDTPLPNIHLPRSLCLFFSSQFSLCPTGINCLTKKGGYTLRFNVTSLFLKHHSYHFTTPILWNTQNLFFTRKLPLLSLLELQPYSYPWNEDTFWNSHFLLRKLVILELKKGRFVREIVKSLFGRLFLQIWDFNSTPVLRGVWRLCFVGCCKGVWVFEWGSSSRRSSSSRGVWAPHDHSL